LGKKKKKKKKEIKKLDIYILTLYILPSLSSGFQWNWLFFSINSTNIISLNFFYLHLYKNQNFGYHKKYTKVFIIRENRLFCIFTIKP